MIDKITYNNQLFALIISHKFNEPGVHFFTEDNLSQQLAFMKHPTGKTIHPHIHKLIHRKVHGTLEVLFIKKGKLRVDFFNKKQKYLESRILEGGDVIMLIQGGHGFEMLEEVEMFEVKQGPYIEASDKTRFKPNLPNNLNFGTEA